MYRPTRTTPSSFRFRTVHSGTLLVRLWFAFTYNVESVLFQPHDRRNMSVVFDSWVDCSLSCRLGRFLRLGLLNPREDMFEGENTKCFLFLWVRCLLSSNHTHTIRKHNMMCEFRKVVWNQSCTLVTCRKTRLRNSFYASSLSNNTPHSAR